jgi:hypothetical protein
MWCNRHRRDEGEKKSVRMETFHVVHGKVEKLDNVTRERGDALEGISEYVFRYCSNIS